MRTTSVRFNGIIHDFMMLNPLREAAATTAAVEQAIHVLRKALRSDAARNGFHGPSDEHMPVALGGQPTR